MASIYLAHIKAWNPATNSEVTLYFSSQGFVTGNTNLPPGGAPNISYNNRIQQPAVMRRNCWKDGALGGETEIGYGAVICVNLDGGLDYLLDYGFDGREITLILGTVKADNGGVPTWTTIFFGKMSEPELTRKTFNIYLRDKMIELDKPICVNKYLGNNVAPDGTEGTADDLLGQEKQVVMGRPKNVAGICVNEIKYIYQFHDGTLTGFSGVYDKGSALVAENPPYNDVADMLANAPAVGKYRMLASGGFIRTGAKPQGQITADPIEGAIADRTCANIIYRILTGAAGISPANISAADIAVLNAIQNAEIGLCFKGDTTCRAAISMAAASAGAWCGFDRLGQFRIKRFDAPINSPVATLTQSDIFDIEHINLEGASVPVWKSIVKYARNWVVQTSDLATGVNISRKEDLAQEFKKREVSTSSIKNAYPLAKELTFETDFITTSAAAVENTRRFNLFKVRRHAYRITAYIKPELISVIDCGVEIRVQYNRFLLSAGKNFIILGMEEDHFRNRFEMTVFG